MAKPQTTKHLIWFNSKIILDEDVKGWDLLPIPNEDAFFSARAEKFRDATVVFLMAEADERGRIIPAARAVLEYTKNVKMLHVSPDALVSTDDIARANSIPDVLLDMDESDFATLADVEQTTLLHPAQDFAEGTIYYGAKIQGKDYLVSSDRELIPLIACPSRGISLVELQLSMAGFSHSRVLDYFSGLGDGSPNRVHADIVSYIRRFIYFPSGEMYDLIAVWIMGTYLSRAFRYYPYLHLNAEKGSGKTLLMELMTPIAFNGILMSQPTASTVLKLIKQDAATLFIDEAEGLGEKREAFSQIKNVLKTGFARSGVHYSGDELYRTYSPKCFAGINMLEDVLADRTITIRLLRKTGFDITELYRETPLVRKAQSELRDRLYLFGLQHGVGIADDYNSESTLYDKLPHLSNRVYDVWVPLFKIVNSFGDGDDKIRVFQSLDKLSQSDARRRQIRDVEENETGLAVAMMDDVLSHATPLDTKDDVKYYDPEVIYESLRRLDLLPKGMQKKGLSRMLKRTLDIDSVPRAFGSGTKRMYAISIAELESYRKRYADKVVD